MQLWTIQPLAFWNALQREKVLRATRQHVIELGVGEYPLPAYDWLREQMIERIGPPPQAEIYPIWAYFQFNDASHRRPDLRRVRWWYPQGERHVLLELKMNEQRVLLSDYGDWHYALNNWYYGLSEEDNEAFEAANHPDELARAIKRESWLKCLDMDFHAPGFSSPRDEKTIQATFWELRLEDVVGVLEFTGSGHSTKF